MPRRCSIKATIVATGFVAGSACRYAELDQVTADTTKFLPPWYEFAHTHGLAGLGQTFTNYTPFLSVARRDEA